MHRNHNLQDMGHLEEHLPLFKIMSSAAYSKKNKSIGKGQN